jgi:hypothetical protein
MSYPTEEPLPLSKTGGLTRRQVQVLSLLGLGLTEKGIDHALHLKKGANYHTRCLRHIFRCDARQLMRIAIAFGLSPLCLILLVGCSAPKPKAPPMPVAWPLVQPAEATTVVTTPPRREYFIPITYPANSNLFDWYVQASPDMVHWTNLNTVPFRFTSGGPKGDYTVYMPTNKTIFFWRMRGVK